MEAATRPARPECRRRRTAVLRIRRFLTGLSAEGPDQVFIHRGPVAGDRGQRIGLWLEAGRWATSRVGIGAEVSVPGSFDAVQQSRVYEARNEHRDVVISGVLRYVYFRAGRTRLDVVGGGGVADAKTVQRSRRRDTATGVLSPRVDEVVIRRIGALVTGGADVQIAVAGRVAITPSLRLYYTERGPANATSLGLGRFLVRTGVGLQASF
jgi:hypothetical protein